MELMPSQLIWSLITEMYVVSCWSLSSLWVNTLNFPNSHIDRQVQAQRGVMCVGAVSVFITQDEKSDGVIQNTLASAECNALS